ncbi:hypothetical protein [Micromonospora sp. NPDC007230]|uniref:hypothetical protein n=1 Tax=Micromonospora sp. NPDC007230 TaxID=3364237 RepID=UPI00368F6747
MTSVDPLLPLTVAPRLDLNRPHDVIPTLIPGSIHLCVHISVGATYRVTGDPASFAEQDKDVKITTGLHVDAGRP